MFAPPPVQLSRAEIHSRLVGEVKHASSNELPETASDGSDKTPSLQQKESRSPTSPFKRRFFGKGARHRVSPVPDPHGSLPENSNAAVANVIRPELEGVPLLPPGFAEHPRQAPKPPKRKVPTSNNPAIPSLPGVSASSRDFIQEPLNETERAPPIPSKSLRRPQFDSLSPVVTEPLEHQLKGGEVPSQPVIVYPNIDHSVIGPSTIPPTGRQRASSTPSMADRKYTYSSGVLNSSGMDGARSAGPGGIASHQKPPHAAGMSGTREASVRNARIHKSTTSAKQFATDAYYDRGTLQLPRNVEPLSRRATDGAITLGRSPVGENIRRRSSNSWYGTRTYDVNGVESSPRRLSIQDSDSSGIRAGEPLPHRLKFMDKKLPDTPTSMVGTPIEVYEYAQKPHRPLLRTSSRRSETSKRSPLAQISATNAKANSLAFPEDRMSPSRLSAIPEHTTSGEKSPVASGSNTPVATHIHLRGGSLVTVSPPELTPWRTTFYIQGPIKLPKPVIVPRKNSVASLEPFQEAIDQVYQDALTIPRRRSDDRVWDDVCDFFDGFDFGEVTLTGDVLLPEDTNGNGIVGLGGYDIERFSTPPGEPMVSPIEKTVAKNIVEGMDPSSPISPVVNEDTFRAPGLAITDNAATEPRTSSQPRKDSMTLSRSDTGLLPMLQLPKESVPGDGSEPGSRTRHANRQPEGQGIEWGADVQELDASSTWIAPAAMPRLKRAPSGRSPVAKVRRLVATATAVL